MSRILIVDDARFIRQLLAKVVKEAGHEVVGEAENGQQAVLLYRSLQPDIVTLDITMPEMDGIAALRKILEIDARARVIVCSAVNTRPKVIEALQAGARDFILKPVHPDRVLSAIDRVMTQAADAVALALDSAENELTDEAGDAEPAAVGTRSKPSAVPKIKPWRARQSEQAEGAGAE